MKSDIKKGVRLEDSMVNNKNEELKENGQEWILFLIALILSLPLLASALLLLLELI